MNMRTEPVYSVLDEEQPSTIELMQPFLYFDVICDGLSYHDEQPLCVYLLLNNMNIVYVGQTTDLRTRLKNHKKDKQFDYYYSRFVPQSIGANELEAELIVKYKPIYNKCLPPNERYASMNQIQDRLQISKDDIARIIKKYEVRPVFGNFYDSRLINSLFCTVEFAEAEKQWRAEQMRFSQNV